MNPSFQFSSRSDCASFRRALARNQQPASAQHARDCAACAAYAGRLEALRRSLREPASSSTPDADFTRRVCANLPRPGTMDHLATAAERLLPLALSLLLALALWSSLSRSPWRSGSDGQASARLTTNALAQASAAVPVASGTAASEDLLLLLAEVAISANGESATDLTAGSTATHPAREASGTVSAPTSRPEQESHP